jgi:hypothetical protein
MGTEKLKSWRSLMNGTHVILIGLTAAALLGLHAGAGALFLVMASAAQTPIPRFAG